MQNNSVSPLRNELDRILKESQAQTEQEVAIEDIKKFYPHSIQPARLENFFEIGCGDIPAYDCFTFALDLIDSQERIAVRDFAPKKIGPVQRPGIADVLPGPNFLHYLQLPKRSSCNECQDYDLAIYSDAFGKA